MTAATRPPTGERLRGFQAVRRSLDEHGVDYEIVCHEHTGSALAEARSYGAPPYRVVKTVALWALGSLRVVALPASECVDVNRVGHLLDDADARIATEAELSHELPSLDPGALPPFGPPAPPLALVDRRVLSCNWVLVNGGDHRHSLRVSPLEIIRISQARVVDIGAA
jgi:prolyl-tRNA editing enzyme YbaK/EbsC (Cys-tRNA(Pro) deacylase)